MSVALRLGVALAALVSACTLNLAGKTACSHDTDCLPGYSCVSNHCKPDSGGGGTAGGGNGGNTGTIDGGTDTSPPRICPTSPVTACPAADPGTSCEETFCGGPLWRNGVLNSVLVPYRILDPGGMFSPSYRTAIRAGATAWARASSGLVTFQDCGSLCSGRFISVVPGDGDGITNPDAAQPSLPMPVVGSGGRVSPHRIAHQWGHVLGLSHTYERVDRDRYVAFDPDVWCPPGGSGLPPRCAAGPQGAPGLPAVTTGTFGVFDEKSKMNGFPSEGICGAAQPDEDSGEPTIGDVSAVAELFFGVATTWSPFRPIGRSPSPNQPLDYQLAPGVDPMGSPALAEVDYASPEIFVRGTDDRVYTTSRRNPLNASTADWLDWTAVGEDVDADPAVVFALNQTPAPLFLAVRSRGDGNLVLSARRGGTWGPWASLAAPPSGAASAPALASESPSSLDVFVRGGDGLIYRLACTDAQNDCAGSASGPDAWTALPAPPSGIFVGKPSALWMLDANGLTVAAIRDDRVAMMINRVDIGGSDWVAADNFNAYLALDDPSPGVAITMSSTPQDMVFFGRNPQGLLVSESQQSKFFPIGGMLASPPGVVSVYHGAVRTDVAAIIVDHGRPGVWWRYNDAAYAAPCYYNRPGTCGECGL